MSPLVDLRLIREPKYQVKIKRASTAESAFLVSTTHLILLATTSGVIVKCVGSTCTGSVGFFFRDTELSIERWTVIPGLSGFNDRLDTPLWLVYPGRLTLPSSSVLISERPPMSWILVVHSIYRDFNYFINLRWQQPGYSVASLRDGSSSLWSQDSHRHYHHWLLSTGKVPSIVVS